MKTAWNLIPPRFADGRHAAVSQGLRRHGYEVRSAWSGESPGHGDLLVTWNLHARVAYEASLRFKAAGRPVVVCEEAYTRRLWPEPHFAMALGGHNGAGTRPVGGPERWGRHGIALKPWQKDGRHILVCAARGMGSPEMREPHGWADDACRRLAGATGRPIVLRRHPGKDYAGRPLEHDLAGAWAVVVWASNSATQALVEGIPVFFEAPHIITAGAAERGIETVEQPRYPERLPVFHKLAWAQWTLDEIRQGVPFGHLLRRAAQG